MEIRLKDVSKRYDKEVLSRLSYSFGSGKLYVIKGVSGCGKTTLLNIIGGVDPEYEGELVLPKKARISYIFQQSLLLSSLSVRDNLLLINSRNAKIEALARDLGIQNLIDRFPETLSGGERQRVAILRALLLNPDVLLADEPTASLDGKNAEAVAQMISGLRTSGRVILVATHDSYFDSYADEIIELDYGTFGAVTVNERQKSEPEEVQASTPGDNWRGISLRSDLKYVLKRRKGILKPKKMLLTALFFLLILLASSVQNNFASEALRIVSKNKPINLLRIEDWQMLLLTDRDKEKMTFYEDYYAEEGDWTAYYLLPKEYSVLNISGMLSFGEFPASDQEILVNETLARKFSGNNNPGSVLGRTVSFCGLSLTIKGVVGTYGNDFRQDYYYCYGKDELPLDFNDQHLFIPYETLKTIGTKLERTVTMAIWPGLFEDKEARARLTAKRFQFNQYYLNCASTERTAAMIEEILYWVLIVLYLIACLYSTSIIRLELFYRRKELGYLQVFGVSKMRVRRWIDLEYGMRLIGSLVLALGAYMAIFLGYAAFTGTYAWPVVRTVATMIILLGLLHLGTVKLVEVLFLRQSIIRLIQK